MPDQAIVIHGSTVRNLGMFDVGCENPHAVDRRAKFHNSGSFHQASMANSRSKELGDLPYVEIQARPSGSF